MNIRFTADDANGDALRFFSPNLPGGSFLNPDTGEFEWTPDYTQAGRYEIPIRVSDGTAVGESTLVLVVGNVNAAPVFDRFDGITSFEGQLVSVRAFAFDADNPGYVPQDRVGGVVSAPEGAAASVTVTASGVPAGALFDPETLMLTWTPGYTQAGRYVVHFTATDDGNGTGVPATSSTDMVITIADANRPPVVPDLGTVHVAKGEVLDVAIAATDPDGNPITYAISGLPRFASLVTNADGTATLRLAPGANDRGDSVVTLTVSDDGNGAGIKSALSTTRTFVISSESPAEAPVLDVIGEKVALTGQKIRFVVNASDLDQDPLVFSADTLPAGATLVPGVAYGTAVFEWTPTPADRGTRAITFRVQDNGNNGAGTMGSDAQTIRLVVRDTNSDPLLLPVGEQTVSEGQPLRVELRTLDADSDTITFASTTLPPSAKLDPGTGVLTWTPNLFQSGRYDVTVTATDGAASSSETFAIRVRQVNQAPVLAGIPPIGGQEARIVSFSLVGTDPDADALAYRALTPLPRGSFFDGSTGRFDWIPDHEQAGVYTLRFDARDASGATDVIDVTLTIADVNRAPVIGLTNHSVLLGETLAFRLAASDPDSRETLVFSADGLPEGAVLDAATGDFRWTPGPGQAGDHLVLAHLTDGKTTTTLGFVVRALQQPVLPDVSIELTPSFPAIPGQPVSINVLADAFSGIASRSLAIDGTPVAIDDRGVAVFTATAPGLVRLVATAVDLDGFTRTIEKTLSVRDPADTAVPVVALDPTLGGRRITAPLAILGTVQDTNLASWQLEIAKFGSDDS